MILNTTPVDECNLSSIKIPSAVLTAHGIGIGDILIFNVDSNIVPLIVEPTNSNELNIYGPHISLISKHSKVLTLAKQSPYMVTVGADPEFFLVNVKNKSIVPANSLLPFKSSIGNDGVLAEFRPAYSCHPETLIKNIAILYKTLRNKSILRKYPHIQPYANSWFRNLSAGFHIHLGIPKEILTFAANRSNEFIRNIVSVLDYYVGLLSRWLDPDSIRLKTSEYGQLGDYRLSMHTIEYRTPGGYFLRTPELARTILYTSHLVVNAFIHQAEKDSIYWTQTDQICHPNYILETLAVPNKNTVRNIYYDKKKLNHEINYIYNKINTLLPGNAWFLPNNNDENKNVFMEGWLSYEEGQEIKTNNKSGKKSSEPRRSSLLEASFR